MQLRILLKSAAFIFVLILADVVLISCYKSKTYKYKYADAHVEIMEADSTHERYTGTDNEQVDAEKLFLDVHLTSDLIAQAAAPQGFFLNPALAMQPNEDFYINTSRLKSIKIKTRHDYNANYPANSDITGICVFGLGGQRHKAETFTDTEFIEKYNRYLEENSKILVSHIPSGFFWFRPVEKAQTATAQQIQVILEMEDGSTLTDNSMIFRLK